MLLKLNIIYITYCNRPDYDTWDMVNQSTINMAQFYRLILGTNIRPVPTHTLVRILGTVWQTVDESYILSFVLDRPNVSTNLSLAYTNDCPDRWSVRPGTLPSDCLSIPMQSTDAYVDRPTIVWTVSFDVRIILIALESLQSNDHQSEIKCGLLETKLQLNSDVFCKLAPTRASFSCCLNWLPNLKLAAICMFSKTVRSV